MKAFKCAASTNFRCTLRKSLDILPKAQSNGRKLSTSGDTQEASPENKIVIPKRIERGPTDILKALASTLKRDYTAPHYKYHDDPFLIPTSNKTKRIFALSQESGRKSAHWIRQEHADLFQHRVADPQIEVFFPKAIYDENSEVDESVLQKLISQHQVSDALTVYGMLEKKNVEMSRDTKQNLLELLCYYNGQNSLEEDWIEERWFRQDTKGREKRLNRWKRNEAADKLFQSLLPPDAASYAALICGKAQFGDIEGAYNLYQEALDAGFGLPVEAFNKLIAGAPTLKEGHELRWQFVEELLATMNQQGIRPDLGTLNAILETISSMSNNRNSKKNALGVLAEFRTMGITPSLASYYFLLFIFCSDRSHKNAVLVSILEILQGQSLEIQDPRDVLFFTEAMANARFHLADLDLAYKLNELLHTADNYNLIGDSYKESIYYRNFFALVCEMDTLQKFMELYDKYVPNVYVPEPGIMEKIIQTVDFNGASDLLPRLWSDVVMFELGDRENILNHMLEALQNAHTDDQQLLQKHADVAWAIWEKVESQNQYGDRLSKTISWTGTMLGSIAQVLVRADRYEQAAEIMKCLDKRQQEVLGVPPVEAMKAFLNKAIERKDTRSAVWCIQYCHDAGYEETIKLGQKLNSSAILNEMQQAALVNIIGSEVVKEQVAVSS